jgi:hypothetical protein
MSGDQRAILGPMPRVPIREQKVLSKESRMRLRHNDRPEDSSIDSLQDTIAAKLPSQEALNAQPNSRKHYENAFVVGGVGFRDWPYRISRRAPQIGISRCRMAFLFS